MPTLLIINGFRFFFFSNENNEPIHVHVVKGNSKGKIWLQPEIQIAYFVGFSNKEEKFISETISKNADLFKIKWHEHFSK